MDGRVNKWRAALCQGFVGGLEVKDAEGCGYIMGVPNQSLGRIGHMAEDRGLLALRRACV